MRSARRTRGGRVPRLWSVAAVLAAVCAGLRPVSATNTTSAADSTTLTTAPPSPPQTKCPARCETLHREPCLTDLGVCGQCLTYFNSENDIGNDACVCLYGAGNCDGGLRPSDKPSLPDERQPKPKSNADLREKSPKTFYAAVVISIVGVAMLVYILVRRRSKRSSHRIYNMVNADLDDEEGALRGLVRYEHRAALESDEDEDEDEEIFNSSQV